MKQSDVTLTMEEAMANVETLFNLRHSHWVAGWGVATMPVQETIDREGAIALGEMLLEQVRGEMAVVEGA